MSRPLTRRFSSFLDRFEERLELDCEQLKLKLIVQVDQQFGVVREKVTELRSRFGGGSRNDRDSSRTQLHLDDPPVETVSLDEWILERNAATESLNAASTSSGGKRKSTASNAQSARKRQKTQGAAATAESNKHVCKYPGCGKTFQRDAHLAMHERIHLGIKPFSCSWPDCRFSADQRSNVVTHVRMSHFKLPQTLSQQRRLNIEDNRNVNEFVQVDNDLLHRRLE